MTVGLVAKFNMDYVMLKQVFTLSELLTALNSDTPVTLELHVSILSPHSIILPEGFKLTSINKERCILSFNNSDGIGLTANNEISDLIIQTNPSNRAIYVSGTFNDLGVLS